MKFNLFLYIFLGYIFIFISNSLASECNKIWLIENLRIDEKNENPSIAKVKAENKVTRIALKKLFQKIVLNSSINTQNLLKEISNDTIDSMIEFRLIKSEKNLSNRYIGTFDFCFIKDKVTRFLYNKKVPWSELYSRPIIVFPVWKTEFGLRLWKDPNPLKDILDKKINNHIGLTDLIFPKTKIGVLRSIDAGLAFDGNEQAISRAIERSGASRALNILFDIRENKDNSKEFEINVIAYIHNNEGKRLGSIYKNIISTNSEKLDLRIENIFDEIIFSLEENWKKANVFVGNNSNEIQIFVSVKNLDNWVKTVNVLGSLPGIKKIYPHKLTEEGVYVNLLVEGGIDRFISIVYENKLPIFGSKKNLIIDSQKL